MIQNTDFSTFFSAFLMHFFHVSCIFFYFYAFLTKREAILSSHITALAVYAVRSIVWDLGGLRGLGFRLLL